MLRRSAVMKSPRAPADQSDGLPLLLAVVTFAGVVGVLAILRHEWWRDEAYTWLVVRASHSPADLLQRLGFNGHPRAYYLLAYGLYQLWPSPMVLSLSNLVFALLAIALLVRSAPFPPIHKALFSLGFFPLYQYGVVARSYSLFLFLLFLYIHLKVRWPKHVAWRLLCLALLAQIHLMSLTTAGVLLFLDLAEQRSGRATWSRASWISAGLVGVSLASSVYQILPRGAGRAVLGRGFGAFLDPANGYLPPFDRFSGPIQIGVGLVLFALSWYVVRQDRATLLRYALLAAPLLGISIAVYGGLRWHDGFYFIYFIAALWLGGTPSPRSMRFLGVVLALHAGVGVYAISEDFRRPYSNGREAARTIHVEGLDRLPVLGLAVGSDAPGELHYAFEIDRIQPLLLYQQAGRAYDPRARTYEPYWRHYAEPDYFASMTFADLVPRLHDIASREHTPLLIVTVEHNLSDDVDPAPAPLRRIARFPRPLDYGERLGLYLFRLE